MGLARSVNVDPIKIIKNFILDAYDDGLSIFQELVQNANDASSTELIFSFLPDGVKGAVNPLLSSPCLLVINDGPFRQEDADIISDVGIGTKATDSNTIGRFGLGLKSIYHWCEAFYFFTTNGKFSALVNPYYNTLKHPEWDYLSEVDGEADLKLLISEALSNVEKKKTYFVLAIPLRTKKLREPFIKKTFYDEISIKNLLTNNSNADEYIRDSFVTMLSTLAVTSKKKTLKSVKFIAEDYFLDCLLTEHGISIKMNDKEKFFASYKSIKCNILEDDKNIIQALQKSPNWPSNESLDDDGNVVKTEFLNAQDSSLLLIKTQNSEKTKYLRICYATYLPLKSPDMFFSVILPDSAYSYTIIFNASFSIDSGRNGILGYREILSSYEEYPRNYDEFCKRIEICNDEKEILKLWNVFLLRNILFPELPRLFYETLS